MARTRISRLLLLVGVALRVSPVLGVSPREACSHFVTAKEGDSCATVSTAYGITVADFIQSNPSLKTCNLVAGAAYCVSGVNSEPLPAPTVIAAPTSSASTPAPSASTPVSSASPPAGNSSSAVAPSSSAVAPSGSASAPVSNPTGGLIPSPDGSDGICGNGYTCLGSPYGQCCSAIGYCGNGPDYCGVGCNPAFGACGSGICEDPKTLTVTVTQAGQNVTTTIMSRVISLVTKNATLYQTQTVTNIQNLTLVSTVTTKQTITSQQTVTTVQTQSVTLNVTRTVTATPTAKPSPILSGTTRNCTKYYQFKASDRCQVIARAIGVTQAQLQNWNPNLDCDDPEYMAGNYICIGVT